MSIIEDEARARLEEAIAKLPQPEGAAKIGRAMFSVEDVRTLLAASRREPSEHEFSPDERAEVAAIQHASRLVRQYVAEEASDRLTTHQLASSLNDLIVYLKWEREQRFAQPTEPSDTAEHPCPDWPAPCNCNDPEAHDGH